MTLLFLQLPRLDPDIRSAGENTMLAAAGLESALSRSPEGRFWRILRMTSSQDSADDRTLLTEIEKLAPDVIGITCYLWNIERSLVLLRQLKKRKPGIQIVLGGPEAAENNPLLLKRSPADVVVVGEGELVFPKVLRAFRLKKKQPPFQQSREPAALIDLIPPAESPLNAPDKNGIAVLETNRGCPLKCAFCCYNLRRKGWSSLPPAEVGRRIRLLKKRGAKEIRLTDPTFNARTDFEEVLRVMTKENPGRTLRFFVELRADTLTEQQVAAMASAGITEAEVGIQSTDPTVLRLIHRPVNLDKIERGLQLLTHYGIRPTIDFMYGLPEQKLDDIDRAFAWFKRFPKAHPQLLPLLLLPGTELRDRAKELKIRHQKLPPYRVLSPLIEQMEETIERHLGLFDSPTRQFAGRRLPDLFSETPNGNRQTLVFAGPDLFARREELIRQIRAAVRREPHILWQFILEPETEEPLDLLDELIAALRKLPGHWLDRLVLKSAARRIFIRVRKPLDPSWLVEAEKILQETFH